MFLLIFLSRPGPDILNSVPSVKPCQGRSQWGGGGGGGGETAPLDTKNREGENKWEENGNGTKKRKKDGREEKREGKERKKEKREEKE